MNNIVQHKHIDYTQLYRFNITKPIQSDSFD